jgi:hypothetical protein
MRCTHKEFRVEAVKTMAPGWHAAEMVDQDGVVSFHLLATAELWRLRAGKRLDAYTLPAHEEPGTYHGEVRIRELSARLRGDPVPERKPMPEADFTAWLRGTGTAPTT